MVFDPTIISRTDSAKIWGRYLQPMRQAIAKWPPRSRLELYVVGAGRITDGAELTDSLPFNTTEPDNSAHEMRALALGDSVSRIAARHWVEASRSSATPASCILTAIRRARGALVPQEAPPVRVSLIVVSDLLELCNDFGKLNLEATVPDSFTNLPDEVDLSGVQRIYLVKAEHPGVASVAQTARLDSVWVRLFRSWGAPEDRIEIVSSFPERPLP